MHVLSTPPRGSPGHGTNIRDGGAVIAIKAAIAVQAFLCQPQSTSPASSSAVAVLP